MKASHRVFNRGYSCTVSYQVQLNYAKILPKGPTNEADDEEVKSSYLAICRFTTLFELSDNIYLENHQN